MLRVPIVIMAIVGVLVSSKYSSVKAVGAAWLDLFFDCFDFLLVFLGFRRLRFFWLDRDHMHVNQEKKILFFNSDVFEIFENYCLFFRIAHS